MDELLVFLIVSGEQILSSAETTTGSEPVPVSLYKSETTFEHSVVPAKEQVSCSCSSKAADRSQEYLRANKNEEAGL